jgi:hypothetical protein
MTTDESLAPPLAQAITDLQHALGDAQQHSSNGYSIGARSGGVEAAARRVVELARTLGVIEARP